MTISPTNGAIYAELREETIRLARGLMSEEGGQMVPQSPAWSIKDVVAHVVGIAADILNENLAEIGSDSWTAAQVDSRAAMSLDEVCDEWESLAAAFDEMTVNVPVMAMRATADLVAHYHDVLIPLGRTGDRDSNAVRLAFERYGPFFCERAAAAGLPIVRIDAGEQSWQSGDGEPQVVWRGSTFDLLRAVSGRRSADQIRAMDWAGDCEPYLAVVTPYGLPERNVAE